MHYGDEFCGGMNSAEAIFEKFKHAKEDDVVWEGLIWPVLS